MHVVRDSTAQRDVLRAWRDPQQAPQIAAHFVVGQRAMLHEPRRQMVEQVIRHLFRASDAQLRMRRVRRRFVVREQIFVI